MYTNIQAHRLIAQVLLIGSQVVGRAFVQAYRQAAANSAAAAANGGSKAAASKLTGSNLITKQTGLDLDEACKILNVKKEGLVMEEILKVYPSEISSVDNQRYDHLFKQNDPKRGGSAYLQAKVFRAKERIDLELKQQAPKLEKEAAKAKQEAATKEGQKWGDDDSMRM